MKTFLILLAGFLAVGCTSDKGAKNAVTGYTDNLRTGVEKAQDSAQKAEERMKKNLEQYNQANQQ